MDALHKAPKFPLPSFFHASIFVPDVSHSPSFKECPCLGSSSGLPGHATSPKNAVPISVASPFMAEGLLWFRLESPF